MAEKYPYSFRLQAVQEALKPENRNSITYIAKKYGIDVVYPKENKDLAQRIIDNGGLLISEYPIGTSPMANYFVATF